MGSPGSNQIGLQPTAGLVRMIGRVQNRLVIELVDPVVRRTDGVQSRC